MGFNRVNKRNILPKFRAGEKVDCENKEKNKVDANLPGGYVEKRERKIKNIFIELFINRE